MRVTTGNSKWVWRFHGRVVSPNSRRSASDGYYDGNIAIQGVRAYDPNMNQWTSPDAYSGDVHDPMSQHPYMWNGNNPVQYSDPTGYETGPAYASECKESGGCGNSSAPSLNVGIYLEASGSAGPVSVGASMTIDSHGISAHLGTSPGFSVGPLTTKAGLIRSATGVLMRGAASNGAKAILGGAAKAVVGGQITGGFVVSAPGTTASSAYQSLNATGTVCATICAEMGTGNASFAVGGGIGTPGLSVNFGTTPPEKN